VRFWDSSAVVPLLIREPETARIGQLAKDDPAIIVWWATRTECVSALARLCRATTFAAGDQTRTKRLLLQLAAGWTEIAPTERLRDRAERLLSAHELRAADAFRLAAALVWSRGRTTGRGFVSLDTRLRAAAAREGFDVLPSVNVA